MLLALGMSKQVLAALEAGAGRGAPAAGLAAHKSASLVVAGAAVPLHVGEAAEAPAAHAAGVRLGVPVDVLFELVGACEGAWAVRARFGVGGGALDWWRCWDLRFSLELRSFVGGEGCVCLPR